MIVPVTEATPHIGTLREKPLHASLKRWYAQPGDRMEAPVDGFVIDLVRGELLIEVQTSGFSSLKQKIATLLDLDHEVRVVHPIPVNKWIVKVEADGTVLDRRRSPKHGSPTDIFSELVSFPDLIAHPHFEIDVILTEEDEYRRHTPGRSWRRKGWTVEERRLIDVIDTLPISSTADLATLLPTEIIEPFTTADLAVSLSVTRRTAQQMAYCLRIAGVIIAVGKKGNAVEYRAI